MNRAVPRGTLPHAATPRNSSRGDRPVVLRAVSLMFAIVFGVGAWSGAAMASGDSVQSGQSGAAASATSEVPAEGTGSHPNSGTAAARDVRSEEVEASVEAVIPFESATSGCGYANATGGEYKDTLCWLDFSGFTTQYTETSKTQTPSKSKWTTTLVYDSKLGKQYGTTVTVEVKDNNKKVSEVKAYEELAKQLYHNTGSIPGADNLYYGNVHDYPVNINLGDGLVFAATLDVTSAKQARSVVATSFPTWGAASGSGAGAFLGRGNFYRFPEGSTVKPAIYQINDANGNTTTAALKGIQLKRNGTGLSAYSIVVADAESTDHGESIRWTTSGGTGFSWLPDNPTAWKNASSATDRKKAAVGPTACSATPSSSWASETAPGNDFTCVAEGNQESATDGAPMLKVSPNSDGAAFTVSQAMTGNGLEGVAFGIMLAKSSLTVQVADRIVDTNSQLTGAEFKGTMTQGEENTPTSVSTGSSGVTATTGDARTPVSTNGTQLAFSSTAAGDHSTDYSVSWTCTKTPDDSGGTSTWGPSKSAPASEAWFKLMPNQYIQCTATYTPPYLTLVKTVNSTGSSVSLQPGDWFLSASSSDSKISGASGTPGVTKKAVAASTYTLSENSTARGASAYRWTDLTCTPTGTSTLTTRDAFGALTGGTVTVAKGGDITCALTNTAPNGSISWAKADATTDKPLAGSEWQLAGPQGTTTVNVRDCVGDTVGACATEADKNPVAGKFMVEGLEWGAYTLTETKAPDGYQQRTDKESATIQSSTTAVDLGNISNTRQTGSVSWSKSGPDKGVLLSGSVWKLVGPDGTTVLNGNLTDCTEIEKCGTNPYTDQDPDPGMFKITGLAWGTGTDAYILTEMAAPAGYKLDSIPHGFAITAAALDYSFSDPFVNQQQRVPDLPLTGGMSTDAFLLGGGGLLGLAGIGGFLLRRRSLRLAKA